MIYKIKYFCGGSGVKQSQEKLNRTLINITKLLNNSSFSNWFIAYGTLLGILRDNNTIDGDDDVDILIDIKYKDKLIQLLKENNYIISYDKPNFLKTNVNSEYSSIDFYLSDVDNDGNFNDTWSKIIWKNCNDLKILSWNDVKLKIPNDPILKLKNRYGETWNIKQDIKVPFDKISEI